VNGLIHGDEHDDQHGHYINAQSPQQRFGSEREIFAAEMSATLGSDDLVRFEQGKNGARILQGELLGLDVNGRVNRTRLARPDFPAHPHSVNPIYFLPYTVLLLTKPSHA
jgi:hypothetical protein